MHRSSWSNILTRLASIFLLAGCGLESKLSSDGADSYQPPIDANLLVISIDTTRADHLGCYGHANAQSPVLDELAQSGARFLDSFTVMPTTLPAHTALFTSQYPRQTGVQSNLGNVSPHELTLAEQLQKHGIKTASFNSSRVLAASTGINQGFDTYACANKNLWPADKTMGMAANWIRENKDSRFFCFVHVYDPHAGYDAPPKHKKALGVQATTSLPPWGQMAFMSEPEGLSQELVEDAARAYDAEIAFVDEQIGILLQTLKDQGVTDDTIVVVTSDHGETLHELKDTYQYAYDHGEFLYPRELRVPLLIHAPSAFGFPPGQEISDAVSLLDLMPTALELMGVPCPDQIEGRSLVPALQGKALDPAIIVAERHSYESAPNPWMQGDAYAVISAPWLLLASHGRGIELFRLDKDRQGLHDLAKKHGEEVKRLQRRLAQWLSSRTLNDHSLAPESTGSERDQGLSGLGYTQGG